MSRQSSVRQVHFLTAACGYPTTDVAPRRSIVAELQRALVIVFLINGKLRHTKDSFNNGPGVSEYDRSPPRTGPTLFASFHTHFQPDGTLVRYLVDLISAVPLDRPSGVEPSSPSGLQPLQPCSLQMIHLPERPEATPSKRDRHMVVSGNKQKTSRCTT